MSEEKGLKKFFSKIKIEYLIVIALAAIIVIIVFSNTSSTKQKEENVVDDYVKTLESKLKKSLSLVDGAGKVEVIISVESGMETVLATKKVSDENTIEETPFIVGGKTVVVTETYPKITGVIIVSEGASNLSVRVALVNASSVFLNIDSSQIQILPMKSKT